jgi:outer membrane protein
MFKPGFTKAALLVASVLMTSAAAAKEMKIGYVDIQAVVQQLPQTAKIQEGIKADFGAKIEEIQKLEKDISFNIEKMKRDGATMNDAQKKQLQADITKQQQQYEQLARPLDEQMRTRQQEERNKLMGLIKTAIDQIAAKDQYDMILNAGAAVYAKPEYDISSAVVSQVSKAK